MRPYIRVLAVLLLATVSVSAQNSDIDRLAHDIFKQLVEMKTTESGVGSTPAAQALAERFRQAGFSDRDSRQRRTAGYARIL